jgi:hypothetical protein
MDAQKYALGAVMVLGLDPKRYFKAGVKKNEEAAKKM